jgi:chemotaxis signal transduction protein
VSGYVTFLVGGQEMAGRLLDVREVVRAVGVEPLPGSRAPVTGLLTLRGNPVPLVDLRTDAEAGAAGDVLVLEAGNDGVLGLAVDRVVAVIEEGDLRPIDNPVHPLALPSYVLEVRRDAHDRPVFVVALRALAGLVPA